MSWFKRFLMLGATVVCIECNGCMATNYNLKYVGKVAGFKNGNCGLEVEIEVFIHREDGDSRDREIRREYIVMDDSSFQKLSHNLNAYYL